MELTKALRQELRANLHSIPQKCEAIRRTIQALEKGELLPGPTVHFFDTIYSTHAPRVVADMTTK